MAKKELETVSVSIDEITPHPKNVRQGDIGAISESLKAHGQYRAIVVQRSTGHILAGNHTWKAAKALGWKQIIAHFIDCDDDKAMRILLADNRANDLASYDEEALTELLKELVATDDGLVGTLYDGDALDELVNDLTTIADPILELKPVLLDEVKRHSKLGDIWLCGEHRVMCGDSRNADDVSKAMNGEQINIAFTSPPYAEQREYDTTSEFKPIPPREYVEWYRPVSENTKQHLATDGSMFINIKPVAEELDTELYVFDLVLAHAREWGWHFATEFCWERFGVPKHVHLRFKNGFEPIYQFALNRWKMRPNNVRHYSDNVPTNSGGNVGATTWNTKQGRTGGIFGSHIKARKQGVKGMIRDFQSQSVQHGQFIQEGLAFPSNRIRTANINEALGHAAVFPPQLPAFFIQAFTDEHDIVYDAFAGSGSTLIAANELNRRSINIEISPHYCDLICARYQRQTGNLPRLEATGETHDFLP